MQFQYTPRGVCSRSITFDLVDNRIHNLQFVGGCHGNLQGIAALVEGLEAEEAVRRLSGIRCGMKSTSCPDQLAQAITSALQSTPL